MSARKKSRSNTDTSAINDVDISISNNRNSTNSRLRSGVKVEEQLKVNQSENISLNDSDFKVEANTASNISEYERIRLENIKRNANFLATLGLDEERTALEQGKSREATRRGVSKKSYKIMAPLIPTRRSGRVTIERLKNELADMSASSQSVEDKQAKETQLQDMISKKNEGSYDINLDALVTASMSGYHAHVRLSDEHIPYLISTNNNNGKQITQLLQPIGAGCILTDMISSQNAKAEKDYVNQIARLKLSELDVAKVTESRITSIFCHPSRDKVLVVAGDKVGCLGIWDVDSELTSGLGGVYRYNPHVSNIAGIHSWAQAPSKIYSVSYDGTIRYIDLEKESFSLAFTIPEDLNHVFLTDASFSTSDVNQVLVGRSDGQASLIDFRMKASQYAWSYQIQNTKLNSVQFHPSDNNLLICGGSGMAGSITIHDLRTVPSTRSNGSSSSWKPIQEMNLHDKSINAAYCSPDGLYLVSVSQDNTIRTWKDFLDGSAKSKAAVSSHVTRHDNHTGRWLSTFRPSFDPKHSHTLVSGSMERPRMIEVFQIADSGSSSSKSSKSSADSGFGLEIVRELKGDYLGSVCSRNCFHAQLNLIAAGNSSGRVHIFR